MSTPFDSRVTSTPINGSRAAQTDVDRLYWRISQHLSRERRTKNQNLVQVPELSFRVLREYIRMSVQYECSRAE